MKNFKETLETNGKRMNDLAVGAPKMMKAFMEMHHLGTQNGALSTKHKELVALGIGIHAQCEGCILAHIKGALDAGATHDEIVETIEVALYMGGGPCVIYGSLAYGALQELSK
ncbi:MAG TPA: carboxymuconolactone decarboxylase family protein [Bacteroidaceae bacterium]|nr:carboxymuconolactone decarboxylase family protein [Bacteroidaceae bacterium]